jgi:hypothetical protein
VENLSQQDGVELAVGPAQILDPAYLGVAGWRDLVELAAVLVEHDGLVDLPASHQIGRHHALAATGVKEPAEWVVEEESRARLGDQKGLAPGLLDVDAHSAARAVRWRSSWRRSSTDRVCVGSATGSIIVAAIGR